MFDSAISIRSHRLMDFDIHVEEVEVKKTKQDNLEVDVSEVAVEGESLDFFLCKVSLF